MTTSRTTTVTTAAFNTNTGCFEVIEREQIEGPVDLSEIVELSAQDLGCEPGSLFRVAIRDTEDNEVDAVEVKAQ